MKLILNQMLESLKENLDDDLHRCHERELTANRRNDNVAVALHQMYYDRLKIIKAQVLVICEHITSPTFPASE